MKGKLSAQYIENILIQTGMVTALSSPAWVASKAAMRKSCAKLHATSAGHGISMRHNVPAMFFRYTRRCYWRMFSGNYGVLVVTPLEGCLLYTIIKAIVIYRTHQGRLDRAVPAVVD